MFFTPIFFCEACNVKCSDKTKFDKHLLTAKHQKCREKQRFFTPKIFDCSLCDFQCSKQSDWNRHIKTKKHLNNAAVSEDVQRESKYKCDICSKKYINYNSFYAHKKKCLPQQKVEDKMELNTDAVKQLIKENTELRHLLVEQNEKLSEHSNMLSEIKDKQENVVINNTQNNRFNINMFLNEKCGSALNFTDFIDRIEVSQNDLENNAQLGFVEGISKILMDNLRKFSLYERPIHCTDLKREIMYIKDEDKWQKNEDDEKLHNAIQLVSRKSISSLLNWKENNPDYKDADSDFSNKCLAIHQQSSAGPYKNTFYPRVIHKLAKDNILDKNSLDNEN